MVASREVIVAVMGEAQRMRTRIASLLRAPLDLAPLRRALSASS